MVDRFPPHGFFLVSAVFHYLGPSFAVLLFTQVEPLGVAWLRIATAAAVLAAWRRPWRIFCQADRKTRTLFVALGATLAAMNVVFYLAIDRIPLATVAGMEFVATIAVAAIGLRTPRNAAALAVAAAGVFALIGLPDADDALGLLFAGLNAALFATYIVLGHAISRAGGARGIDALAAAMMVAFLAAAPFGVTAALPAMGDPLLLLAAIGVGLSSSVIPYVCDQLAMARLPRATFALMLALLPATAAVVGAVVLGQVPSPIDIAGIGLVAIGVAIHRPPAT